MVCQTFELCVITYAYKKQRSQRSEQNKTGVHVSVLCTMACLGADHLRDDLGNHCRYSMRACKMLLRKVTSLVIMNNLINILNHENISIQQKHPALAGHSNGR